MKVTRDYHYKQSVEEIAATYLDDDFLQAQQGCMGGRNIEINVDAYDDDTYEVCIDQEKPSDIPSYLKTFAAPWNRVVVEETWEGSEGGPYNAESSITIEKVPVNIDCKIRIAASGKGCKVSYQYDISSGVPLVGKKIAEFAANQIF